MAPAPSAPARTPVSSATSCGTRTPPRSRCARIKYHVKLPIFVARQWIRHRTASVNEYSARYSILDNEFYVPAPEHLAAQSTSNRQGRGQTLSGDEAARVFDLLRTDAERSYEHYEEMLNEDVQGHARDESRQGLARELARINLTLNFYTQWYWKVNLHNLLHFLWLRNDAHAQYEIRAYATVMLDTVRRWAPLTYGRLHGLPRRRRQPLRQRPRSRPPPPPR